MSPQKDPVSLGERPPQRLIKRILVANRGEIAIRLLQSCRELPSPPETFAIFTDADMTHVSLGQPHDKMKIPSPASYMDIGYLIALVKEHKIDAVHPGYGFLSESPEFSKRMWDEANCMVVGPGWAVLESTGDKLKAKSLAQSCRVPVLKAMSRPTSTVDDVVEFSKEVGLPLMIKAVDGGGGRGIRLVKSPDQLRNAVERCIGESPSRKVFAEQAAVDGFKHIEVQIIGDGRGGVKHLWERDCSVQRRFQKIVEVAPTPLANRRVIGDVIESAVKMARQVKYLGLGTFEFLVNLKKRQCFFLEINPRLQVEHTVTESICGLDIVREQLLIAQGLQDREDSRLGEWFESNQAPRAFSIQLRLCAEDSTADFALSIGKVSHAHFPTGNGVRVDSHLAGGGTVGSDFDNLMAKIIVTASHWEECLAKAQRALAETRVDGVKSNLNLLRAVVADKHFRAGRADTKWLESNLSQLVETGEQTGRAIDKLTSTLPALPSQSTSSQSSVLSSGGGGDATSTPLRPGDAWSLTLQPPHSSSSTPSSTPHHLHLDRITTNLLPDHLSALVTHTQPGQPPQQHHVTLTTTTASSAATSSTHRRGDPRDPNHVCLPMSGKLVEVLVQPGDHIAADQVVAFVRQMKMELEVRSPRAGKVVWVIDVDGGDDDEGEGNGEDVAEGVLLCELEKDGGREGEGEGQAQQQQQQQQRKDRESKL